MTDILATSLKAAVTDKDKRLFNMGIEIGKLYTDHGLPIDMALDKVKLPKEQKLAILNGALSWLIQHRRNSNATDKAIERQRKTNQDMLERFINTGETGAY